MIPRHHVARLEEIIAAAKKDHVCVVEGFDKNGDSVFMLSLVVGTDREGIVKIHPVAALYEQNPIVAGDVRVTTDEVDLQTLGD